MFLISDRLLESSLCYNCKRYLSVTPIRIYPNKTTFCGRCSTHPADGGFVSKANIVLQKAVFPCINRFEGCNQLLNFHEVRDHEKTCKPRFKWNCLACICGNYFDTLQLYMHYNFNHNKLLVYDDQDFLVDLHSGLTYLCRSKHNLLFFILFKDQAHLGPETIGVKVWFLGITTMASAMDFTITLKHLPIEEEVAASADISFRVAGICSDKGDEIWNMINLKKPNVQHVFCKFSLPSVPETLRFLPSSKNDTLRSLVAPQQPPPKQKNTKTFEGNDALVDYLVTQELITNPTRITALRRVDRALFFLPKHKTQAYTLSSWENGYLHICTPEIYAIALGHEYIAPSLYFLHVGSGSGYFSTVIGMLVDQGHNIGVDVSSDAIQYAEERISEFALDTYSRFSRPILCRHNILSDDDGPLKGFRFDFIFCSATCLEKDLPKLKRFLATGGILIVPIGNELCSIYKEKGQKFEKEVILNNVSIPALIQP